MASRFTVLEPWFNLDGFILFYNDTGDWSGIEKYLRSIGEPEWHRIKSINQQTYDQLMTPERVAEYFVHTALD